MIRTLPRTMSGKQHFKLEGLVIAIVTPFQPYNLRVDEDSFIKYLQACPPSTWHDMASPSQSTHCTLLCHFSMMRTTIGGCLLQYLWDAGVRNIVVNG